MKLQSAGILVAGNSIYIFFTTRPQLRNKIAACH